MYSRIFHGTIWTNHALKRLKERGISQGDAWVTFTHPDSKRFAESRGGWIMIKTISGWVYQVVAKQNERKEWVILSVWAKPESLRTRNRKAKKRHWIIRLLRQIFLGDYR